MSITGSIWEDLKLELRSGNMVSRLIFINVVVFLLLRLLEVIFLLFIPSRSESYALFSQVLSWMMIPADPVKLLMRPWTLITHMFTHYGILHLVFNMLWLYWFGNLLRSFLGNKKILPLYLLGGIAGALLLVLSYNIFPGLVSQGPYVQALGASAGVLAIVVATATLVPDYTIHLLFLGAVKIKYIALVLVILDIIGISGSNAGGSIAHLGGAAFGYFFIRQLRAGRDWSAFVNNLFDSVKAAFTIKRKPRVIRNETAKKSPKRPKPPQDVQERIDAILDKISQSGYDSLTSEEKEFLFRASQSENEKQ